jgi:hypothetical protein
MKAVTIACLALQMVALTTACAQHAHDMSAPAADSVHMANAADAAMSMPMSGAEALHLEMSPVRAATHDDSARATAIVRQLRTVLAKYADTAMAVADGYRLFAPQMKQQRVYHFTNYRNAFAAAFRFEPDKPTSILYSRDSSGKLQLIGAMYTAPKRLSADALDSRVPLSIARWHKHVNWCIPPRGANDRWTELKDGAPVFGPRSPIATRAACDAAGGRFFESPFGWMVHANVFAGDSLSTIFAHEH